MAEETFDKATAVKLLNQIMEAELAGVLGHGTTAHATVLAQHPSDKAATV